MSDSARKRGTNTQNGFYNPQQLDDRSVERQALLDEALAGSDQAHMALVHSYRTELIRYFAGRLSDALRRKLDPEDLAQTATWRAWQKFAGFIGRELRTYRAWLITICRNLIKRLMRFFSQAKRDLSREELLDELRLADGEQHAHGRRQQSADEIVEALETSGRLEAALTHLPDDQRQIVVWRLTHGLAFAEIARRLARSNDMIERTFRRAVQRLKKRLASATPAS